eukprot:2114071-Rhodomonas_salina.1
MKVSFPSPDGLLGLPVGAAPGLALTAPGPSLVRGDEGRGGLPADPRGLAIARGLFTGRGACTGTTRPGTPELELEPEFGGDTEARAGGLAGTVTVRPGGPLAALELELGKEGLAGTSLPVAR